MSADRATPKKTRASVDPRCVLCQQPASESERTSDGTYLHTRCGAAVAPVFAGRAEKGGNHYAA